MTPRSRVRRASRVMDAHSRAAPNCSLFKDQAIRYKTFRARSPLSPSRTAGASLDLSLNSSQAAKPIPFGNRAAKGWAGPIYTLRTLSDCGLGVENLPGGPGTLGNGVQLDLGCRLGDLAGWPVGLLGGDAQDHGPDGPRRLALFFQPPAQGAAGFHHRGAGGPDVVDDEDGAAGQVGLGSQAHGSGDVPPALGHWEADLAGAVGPLQGWDDPAASDLQDAAGEDEGVIDAARHAAAEGAGDRDDHELLAWQALYQGDQLRTQQTPGIHTHAPPARELHLVH